MKRILAIAFVLQVLISSASFAFEPPTNKRWLWLGSTDEMGCWVDTESMEYRISDMYPHDKHKQVDVWVLFYTVKEDTSSKQRMTLDLTCQNYKINSVIRYDKKGKIIGSSNRSYAEFESVIPETWSETIFEVCKIFWENSPRNQFK